MLNSFSFQNSFFFFLEKKNCRSKSVKLGLQLENLEASLQQHVTWPLSLTCEDTEGFLTDERHSMGHMLEVKLNRPCLRTSVFNKTFSKQQFCLSVLFPRIKTNAQHRKNALGGCFINKILKT